MSSDPELDRCPHLFRQALYDRTIWPIIPVAGFGKRSKGAAHGVQRARLATQLGRARFRQCLHFSACPTAIRPQGEQRADFLDRKRQVTRIGDEPQPVNIGVAIVPVAAAPGRRGNEPDLFIVADHALGDAAGVGCRPDVHSFTALSRSALRTTVNDDSAIAAPAIIGDSSRPATV